MIYSLVFIGLLALTIGMLKQLGYRIVYSATNSMPRGFYLVVPVKKIARYDIVEFIPPPEALSFLKEHLWVPERGAIIKYVYAIPGDKVCIRNQAVFINDKKIGRVHKFYAPKKRLPQIKICGKLMDDQYLLLSTKSERSFDGRYFGLISSPAILGRAVPIGFYDNK